MLAGYSYEEARRLAEANHVENCKNAEKGVLQFFKGIFDLVNDPVSLKDAVVGTAEQIGEKVKGITFEEALMLLTTNGTVYLINRETLNALGKSMKTYFYADDETAYQTIGRDLGMVTLAVIASEAVKKVKGGGKKGKLTIIDNGNYSTSEINAAQYMADLGNDVVLRPPTGTRAGGGTSDLLVNGINYDVYTLVTSNPSAIIRAITKKNTQTVGIVLDLSNTTVMVEDLGNILERVKGAIEKSGGTCNINDIVVMPK